MNTIIIVGLCLFVYINIGFFLARLSWNRYEPFTQNKKFSLINFLLWPTSTLDNINIIESDNGTPIIEDFDNNISYISIVTLTWPLKVIFNIVIIAFVSFLLSMMVLWRIFITICLLLVNFLTIYKKIYTWDMIKNVWKKPLIIKDF
jgi:hypothetical protein